MAKQTERHDINDELYIFKQDNSERWYARFILTNHKKWLCKSTKKKDKDEAIAMAHRIFLDHQIRHENNTLVQSKRFKDVADRVIEKLEEQLGRVDLCCTYFAQQYIGNHININASDTMLA